MGYFTWNSFLHNFFYLFGRDPPEKVGSGYPFQSFYQQTLSGFINKKDFHYYPSRGINIIFLIYLVY